MFCKQENIQRQLSPVVYEENRAVSVGKKAREFKNLDIQETVSDQDIGPVELMSCNTFWFTLGVRCVPKDRADRGVEWCPISLD